MILLVVAGALGTVISAIAALPLGYVAALLAAPIGGAAFIILAAVVIAARPMFFHNDTEQLPRGADGHRGQLVGGFAVLK